ncbi:MAG: diguanylate cyclase [Pseudomonadota bacterium]
MPEHDSPVPTSGNANPRALGGAYLTALGIVALLIVAGQVLVDRHLSTMQNIGRTINLAGRQRMQYLVISRAAMVLAHGPDGHDQPDPQERTRAAQQMASALEPWRQVHRGLLYGDPGLGLERLANPRARRLLEEMEPARQEVISAVQEAMELHRAGRYDDPRLAFLAEAIWRRGDAYLKAMDRLVMVYDQDAKRRISDLHRLEWILTLLTLLTLVMVGLFIFRPMARRIRNDMAELSASAEAFEQLSLTDGLTGLDNRRALDRRLDEEWRRAWRNEEYLALLMLDIDFFKKYNDRYGHQEGDRALKAVAQAFQSCLRRAGDRAARYGGEELAALLASTDLAGAGVLAEEVRRRVEELNLEHGDSPISPVLTVSLGVAAARPRPGSRPQELLKAADQALYRAKDAGRNRVEVMALDLADAPGPEDGVNVGAAPRPGEEAS